MLPPDELLNKHRTILLHGEIDDRTAQHVIAKLLFLQHDDARAPASLYIDSQGGVVSSSFAIRDTIDHIKLPVFTHCLGTAGGMALVVLAHGARGHRSAAPSARLSLVPLESQSENLDEHVARSTSLVISMLVADTGQNANVVARDVLLTRQFDSESARSYGLVDQICQ
jgi:ATP-dependent Clp protease, protease subunit